MLQSSPRGLLTSLLEPHLCSAFPQVKEKEKVDRTMALCSQSLEFPFFLRHALMSRGARRAKGQIMGAGHFTSLSLFTLSESF